mmetsp:Transcript_23843/g.74251  ORF Transcript_23843/g.74251 Transcript_23843/m.74251 type:complete len:334 (+) Transcript_23843:99-1100(+)
MLLRVCRLALVGAGLLLETARGVPAKCEAGTAAAKQGLSAVQVRSMKERRVDSSDDAGNAALGEERARPHEMWVPRRGGGSLALAKVSLNEDLSSIHLGGSGQLHSQVGQDWLVASLLGCKRGGFFLDLAANDAVKYSNSLMLERDFGWEGICVEANPAYRKGLLARRCRYVAAAVGSPTGTKVEFVFKGVFGGIKSDATDIHRAGGSPKRTMYTVSLQDLLKSLGAPRTIDYFSLDVEGAESMVMKDFPWEEYTFSVLTVERPKPDLAEALRAHGYRMLRVNSRFNDQTWIHEGSWKDLALLSSQWGNGANSTASSCMASAHGLAWPSALQT